MRPLAQVASVRHVLVVRNDGSDVARVDGRDHAWAEFGRDASAVPTVACDPNDPFMIIYTSGTTGAPKGIVHSHVGYLVKSGLDFGYAFDIQPDDRLGWIADMGWMLGPLMIVGGLQFGAGIVFIEGLPNHPDAQPAVAHRRAQPRHGSGHRADRRARPARRAPTARRRRRTSPACAPSPRPARPGTIPPGTGCSRRSARSACRS